jgi:NAD(P)-dependent dehydrogenase (short-subunit alcohol dehydrogenase family)
MKTKGTVLITGAAKRLGRAMSLHLASLGYSVAIHYNHSEKEAKTLANLIKSKKGQCALFPADLTNEKETNALIANVKKTFPQLNVLINNASFFEPSAIKTCSIEHFSDNLNVHLKAPFILTKRFAAACQKGNIINILDTNIIQDKTSHFAYLLSKKSLLELTKLSAVELGPHIRVNAIAPGLILPPEGESIGYLKKRAERIPLKKIGDLQSILTSIEFLLNNPYVTGQVIFNDGGEHLL